MKIELFDYPSLERVTLDSGVRYYVDPTGEHLPSVTTILSATKDTTHLDAWAERVGHDEAEKIKNDAAVLGTLLHGYLEDHLLARPRSPGSGPLMFKILANKMADTIIQKGLSRAQAVHGIEAMLYYPGLYAGTTDLVLTFDNELAIGDFKNTIRMKRKEWIDDYFCQTASYAIAHDKLFGTDVKKLVIMMCSRTLEYENYVVQGSELEKFKTMFLRKLENYQEIQAGKEPSKLT